MIDVPNNLIGAIGLLNKLGKERDVIWQIIKRPDEDRYQALITPMTNDNPIYSGAMFFEADYIDDLIGKIHG